MKMSHDTGSGRVIDKGPITRSAREALSKKVVVNHSTTPHRKSERLEKRTPPKLAVSTKSEKQKKRMESPSPLRRSERTRNASLSDPSVSKSKSSGSKTPSKKHVAAKHSAIEASDGSEDEERDMEASSKIKVKRMDARAYRAIFEQANKDCLGESSGVDRSTKEGDDEGGGRIDECFKGNCLDSAKDDKGSLPPEDAKGKEMRAGSKLSGPVKELLENNGSAGSLLPSNATTHEASGAPEKVQSGSCKEEMSGSRDSILNENLISRCAEHEKGEKSISSKRKKTMVDMHSDDSDVDRSTKEGNGEGGGKTDECFKGNCLYSAKDDKGILPPEEAKGEEMSSRLKLSGLVKELLKNNVTVGSLVPSNAATYETSGTPERVQPDSCKEETSQMSGSRDFILNQNLISRCAERDKCEKSISYKRKRTMVDMHSDASDVDRSTKEGDDGSGGKADGCFKGNCLDSAKDDKGILPPEDAKGEEMSSEPKLSGPVKELSKNNVTVGSLVPSNAANHETGGTLERVQSDSCKEETSQMSRSRDFILNENLISRCAELDKGEKSISYKRKRTMVDMHSDASNTLVDDGNGNLMEDACSSRICSNLVGTNGPCSKRIRQISLPDVQRDQRKLTNNVDHSSPKSNGEKLSTRKKEGKSGGSVESKITEGNIVEPEKIRTQQRNLHLLLKPEIANLCEILCLPDKVKSMVESCLEYTMNNYQICTEPVSILQAFQLSLCWTAAALLNHKLNFEASLSLAKQHLNFDCKKEVVDEINSRLWDLKENFLSLTGNSKVTGSTKVSESSNGVYSYTEVTPVVELPERNNSKNIENIQNRTHQWDELLLMQQKEKQKLKKDIEIENADFVRRYKIEWAGIRSYSPNDVMRKEKLKVFNSEYVKRIAELERQHDIRLKDLEAMQLEARQKFPESSVPDDLLNTAASKELGTRPESLQTHDQAQNHNAPKAIVSDHVAERKSFDIVEVVTRAGTGVGLSEGPNTNSCVIVPCSSPVELENPLVKHTGASEMDIVASKDGPGSENKCNHAAENEYDSQGNVSKPANSREQCSDGAINMEDKSEGGVNFSCQSRDDCGQDATPSVPLPSNEETHEGKTSGVLSGEVALAVCKTSSSNNDHVEVPSSGQGTLSGTIVSKPVCGLSIEVKANGSYDDVKNMTPLNSESSEEHIPCISTMCMSNCENAAQILSDEIISSQNPKSPQDHAHNVNIMCLPNYENSVQIHDDDDDGRGSNNVILNSPLIDERNAHGTIVLNKDVQVKMSETVNFTPSTEQISGGAVDVLVLDNVLSRPCGAGSPSNSSDVNAIVLLNQPQEKQNPDGVSSILPAGEIPSEVSETSHKVATENVLDGEETGGMPRTVNCADNLENVAPNYLLMDQISDGGSVLDVVVSSGPCTTSPNSGCASTISLSNPLSLQQQTHDRVLLTGPDEQIPVLVPENSHEEAEYQLTDNAAVDKSTTSDQQGGVCRTMTENSVSQQTPVSRSVDSMEPLEQLQPLSSVDSPPDQDIGREAQDTLVSSPIDIVPTNQSIHVLPVMEPPEQEGILPSEGFLSSNQALCPLVTGTEDQPTNEDLLPSHNSGTSIEIQNQAIVQHASNLELESCSRQVVHPALNLDLDSPMLCGVRPQSSDIRNLPTQAEINNHPIQTATQSASMLVLCQDPLKIELERLRRVTEQNMKNYENMKLQLKCDFEKEFEELRRKFENKGKEIEIEFQKTRKNLDAHLNIVLVNKILAEAFRAKSMDLKEAGASGMAQDASLGQQLFQWASQQNATRPSLVAGSSSCGPPAPILQGSYAATSSQTIAPPVQATYNTSGTFSSVSARLSHINSMSSPSGNLQAVGEIRSPAPHLQHFRPSTSTSAPASNLCTVLHGRPMQPAPSNVPVTSSSFAHRPPRPTPATFQSDPHRGYCPVSTGGLPIPNLTTMNLRADANSQPGTNLPNVLPHMPDLASLNLSKFGTSTSVPTNSAPQATSPDVVCLSDDD
ncbi:uncharacterized protein LOC113857484 isoform X2 [Abrus precatorius]|uniref:Uncharacterized protein LOC113857484 isoform X2 n=1 Tax=Abrus precatorius TaxID=3816 RepID=A0A8B8KRF0_ABRPR|nr:uncharacterized protein LOC113857484 isoform X2 [Abrus precatorius]